MSRNTGTGKTYHNVLKEISGVAARKHGYTCEEEVVIGPKPGGGDHRIDLLLRKTKLLGVSAKTQNSTGSAEEKLYYEIIKMLHAVETGKISKGIIVLGGDGWSKKLVKYAKTDLYELVPTLTVDKVSLMSTDEFITWSLHWDGVL